MMTMMQTSKAEIVLLLRAQQQMRLILLQLEEGNQSTSEVRDHIQEACIALQVGDTQGALMFLDMALSALGDGGTQGGGNMTNTPAGLTDGHYCRRRRKNNTRRWC